MRCVWPRAPPAAHPYAPLQALRGWAKHARGLASFLQAGACSKQYPSVRCRARRASEATIHPSDVESDGPEYSIEDPRAADVVGRKLQWLPGDERLGDCGGPMRSLRFASVACSRGRHVPFGGRCPSRVSPHRKHPPVTLAEGVASQSPFMAPESVGEPLRPCGPTPSR